MTAQCPVRQDAGMKRSMTTAVTMLASVAVLTSCSGADVQVPEQVASDAESLIVSLADQLRTETSKMDPRTPGALVVSRVLVMQRPGGDLALMHWSTARPTTVTVMARTSAQTSDFIARICARLVIEPGMAGRVTATSATCPELDQTSWRGSVDGDVRLDREYVAAQTG